MRAMLLPLTLVACLGVTGCSTLTDLPTEQVAKARLSFADGRPAETAELTSDGRTLTLAITASGLEPGEHGFHLHTTGRCEAPGFTSAGGHLNPDGREHGSLNPAGAHLGDLPNLVVGATRTASTQVDVGDDTPTRRSQIFDADGTAVIVHAGPDDYRSDPAGDAGARVACGVITAV